jgi:hypothetical protein
MKWSVHQIRGIARALAWFGIAAIVVLSVVPADERPVTGIGQVLEHLTAFGLVAGMFAIGYRFTLTRLLLMALLFCGGIELLQVPLPTRHARVSDFAIDLLGSSFAIGLAWISQTYRCIGAENLRKMLCCNSFYEVEESPDADRVYAEAV